jgi:DivIVA domain-containing protein
MLMGILDAVVGCVLILLAVTIAPGRLRQLVRSRRDGGRLRATPDSVWTGLLLSLTWACFGMSILLSAHHDWSGWGFSLTVIGALASVAAIGTVSGRNHGVAWWRLWARAAPPPSGAELRDSDRAVTLDSGPAIALDAATADLIERIKNATFATTRFSTGYDEEEVDTFLDRLVAILRESGLPDPEGLRNVGFATTRLRPGYVMQDVDRLLREISQATAA